MINKKRLSREKKGITLVALVITVIILLILAGVTIYLTFGQNGLLNKTQDAVTEHTKQEATEKIKFKVTTAQMKKYAEKQRMPTLKELAEILKEDSEIEYVMQKSELASIKYDVGDNPSVIFTKLSKYPYEFEINSSLQIASIDGNKIENIGNVNVKNASLEITNVSSIGCDVKVKESFEDALYVYLWDNKIQTYGKESNIKIENCEDSKEYAIKVIIIENNGDISIAEEKFTTKQAEYLYKNGTIYDLAGNFEIAGYVGATSHSLNLSDNNMIRLTENVQGAAVFMRMHNTINCSKYSKIYVELDDVSKLTNYQGVFISTKTNYNGVNDWRGNLNVYVSELGVQLPKITCLDISKIDRNDVYLYVRQTHPGSMYITRIWLEE